MVTTRRQFQEQQEREREARNLRESVEEHYRQEQKLLDTAVVYLHTVGFCVNPRTGEELSDVNNRITIEWGYLVQKRNCIAGLYIVERINATIRHVSGPITTSERRLYQLLSFVAFDCTKLSKEDGQNLDLAHQQLTIERSPQSTTHRFAHFRFQLVQHKGEGIFFRIFD